MEAGRIRGRDALDSGSAEFTEPERRLVRRLSIPAKVQAWLRGLPYNYEERRETIRVRFGFRSTTTISCVPYPAWRTAAN